MTSIPPAEPRPPSSYPPDAPKPFANLSFGPNSSTARRKGDGEFFSSQDTQSVDDRPTKRRKLSTDDVQPSSVTAPNTSTPKLSLVDDVRLLKTVLRAKPAEENEQESTELPPLPKRPWQTAPAVKGEEEPPPTHRARSPIPVPTIPDTAYKPDRMPQLSNKKHVAYFPWTGTHAEDVLSEINVKQGFYERPPNPQERETNTARVPLYNTLKHRSGLESLSTLFSLVLEAKSKHGLISSASAFKPPPRVTLAEAKRKSWITDLADLNVPLRKLSRTIPQGIRGQGLLDQCIQNNVPLSRVVWFAKCVGANEIRTLKRKGTTPQAAVGTESKWLREWTVNAEQFIENILAQVGQSDWKAKIQYALRLATRLYLENLVDRDHYLDWIVKSFVASSDERLPFWLMVVHIHEQDTTKFRKRGRMLAEALITKYSKLKDLTHGMIQSLVKKLASIVKKIALRRSSCFLMPEMWPSIQPGLASCLDSNSPIESQILRRLSQVNERCMGFNKHSYLARPDVKDRVVGILDMAKAPIDTTSLSRELLSTSQDAQQIIHHCLEWATTKFRCGSIRVYLTTRLLRQWQRQGIDVDSPILDYLKTLHQTPDQCDSDAVRHIFSELSRSHTLSVSRYLQWLNVRGIPQRDNVRSETVFTASGKRILRQRCLDEAQVLMDLSMPRSGGHVINLRNAVLSRAGFDAEAENGAADNVLAQIHQDLAGLVIVSQLESSQRRSVVHLLSDWSWSFRTRISFWLRSYVAKAVKNHMPKADEMLYEVPTLSIAQFDYVRTALEVLNDGPVLADVIGLCSTINDERIHASLVESMTRHAEVFSAIGALESLQTKFCQMYVALRSVKLTMPLFATALSELCATIPSKITPVRLLQQDLIRGDRGRAMAACSPFSDGIAESLQQAETTFIDDFEAVLQSEPSMHEQTMARLFALLTERIEKQQGTIVGEDALFSYCQLMARLRLCRKLQGDQLLKAWLTKALSKYAATFTRNLVYSLTGTGCLTIDILVETISAIERANVVAHHGWLISPDTAFDHPCVYTATTKWSSFGMRKPQEALNLLGLARAAERSPYERQFCTNLIIGGSQDHEALSEASRKILDGVLRSLLGNVKTTEPNVGREPQTLNVLSFRFVQAQLTLGVSGQSEEEDAVIANTMLNLINDADGEHEHKHVASILETAGDGVASQVRRILEDRIVDLLPKLPNGKSVGFSFDDDPITHVKRAIDQAFEIWPNSPAPSAKTIQKVIDALSQMLRFLGNPALSNAAPRTPTVTSPTAGSLPLPQTMAGQFIQPPSPNDTPLRPVASTVIDYLRLVLQFLCLLHPSASTPSALALPSTPKQASDAIKIVAHLVSIITHPAIVIAAPSSDTISQAATREVIDFAYDVMATYADMLSDEGRVLLTRILKDKLNDNTDSRLKWILGSVNTYGSSMPGGEELGKGLLVVKRDADGNGRPKVLGEWRPKVWEVLETGGRGDADVAIGLGMFGARRV